MISFRLMPITYFMVTKVRMVRLGIAFSIASASFNSRIYSPHSASYFSSISLMAAKRASRPLGPLWPPGIPVIFCVMFHSLSCCHSRFRSVALTSCMVYSTRESIRISLFLMGTGSRLSLVLLIRPSVKIANVREFTCRRIRPTVLFRHALATLWHSSGRLARTSAVGIGGHTALPQRATCSDLG